MKKELTEQDVIDMYYEKDSIFKPLATQFFASMCQIFLITLNTTFIIDKNIVAIGIVALGISGMWMINVSGALSGWRSRVAIMVGGSIGAMLSIPFSNLIK